MTRKQTTGSELASSAGRIAALCAAALEETLAPAPGEKRDTKSARDLSAILKDMTALERELNTAGERRGVTVRFEGGTADAAE